MINFQILKQFLRGCKFSLERSKEKLDNFHLVKGALPEWFDRSAKCPDLCDTCCLPLRKCILSGKKVGPLWTWSSRIIKARSLFTSARLWRPGENGEKHFFSVTNIYTLFNPFSVIIGNIKFSFQGRFVVLCSFGKINPSKVICSLSWHSWNRFDKYNWDFPIF